MIVAWMFNTIEPSLRASISYRDVAFDLWRDIKERFSVGNGVKIYQVKSELSDCKQRSGEKIMSYYGRLKKLWDDLDDFDPLPSCDCSGCKCNLTTKLRKRRDDDQVREFLMGLESFYANTRSSLLGIEPLPSLNIVYSRLIQEEEVRMITGSQEEGTNPMSFAVRGNTFTGRNSGGAARVSNNSIVCTFCSKTGHTEEKCFVKHGYPEGWLERRRGMNKGRGQPGNNGGSGGFQSSSTNQQPKANVAHTGEVVKELGDIRLNGPSLEDQDWCG
ncbi:unnamed protein product [Cuscuta epithymum]|nr:unnamed protein product [Cuscuta epithymum]